MGDRQEVLLRHQAIFDVYEFSHTIRGMGMTHAWLEKCVAVDAKMDMQGDIGYSATTWYQYYSMLVICVCECPRMCIKIMFQEHAQKCIQMSIDLSKRSIWDTEHPCYKI